MDFMKAARVYGVKDIRVDEVEIPKVEKGSIRIKVKACAICGSDRRILNIGDFRMKLPVIIGHEVAGIVDAVDRGVKDIRVGDRVCVAPGYACGRCRNCVQGKPNICLNPYPSLGYAINGGFAEYMSVPVHLYRFGFINKISDSLSFKEASQAEIIACALNAQSKVKVCVGDNVLILGAGPAGIINAHLAKHFGATKVTLAQRGSYRLALAKELFPKAVNETICMAEIDLETAYMDKNNGRAPDVVMVCAPSNEAQELACRIVAPGGRVNFFAGLPSTNPSISIDANSLHYKEYTVTGASSSKQIDNVVALQLLEQKIIDGEKLVTSCFKLEDIKRAFECAEEKNCLKVVVEF